jgi:Icc-related predicted phosphoesterase
LSPLFRRRSKPVRLLVASDIHGAEGTWRKYLNALRMGAYEADAGLYAGDLTGKALVPVVADDGGWTAELSGRRERARDADELAALERRIADRGYDSHVCSPLEWRALGSDQAAVDELFQRKVVERVQAWMDLADERLGEDGPPVVLVPGNDDDEAIDGPLGASSACANADGRVVEVGDFGLLGFAYSQPTPWHTPRELSEEEIGARLDALARSWRSRRARSSSCTCRRATAGWTPRRCWTRTCAPRSRRATCCAARSARRRCGPRSSAMARSWASTGTCTSRPAT